MKPTADLRTASVGELHARAERSPALRLWGAPVGLAMLTASGLASALVAGTWGAAWSWFALGVPVAVMLRCAFRSTGSGTRRTAAIHERTS